MRNIREVFDVNDTFFLTETIETTETLFTFHSFSKRLTTIISSSAASRQKSRNV